MASDLLCPRCRRQALSPVLEWYPISRVEIEVETRRCTACALPLGYRFRQPPTVGALRAELCALERRSLVTRQMLLSWVLSLELADLFLWRKKL